MLEALREQWNAAVADFQAKLNELNIAQRQLFDAHSLAAKDPDDLAEWQSQMDKINAIQSSVERAREIISGVSSAWGAVTSTFGLSGWRRKGIVRSLTGRNLAGLGVLPVIPVGALVAIVASIAGVVASVVRFLDYLQVKENNRYSLDITQRAEDARSTVLEYGGTVADANAEAAAVVNREAGRRAAEQTGYSTFDEFKKIGLMIFGGFVVLQILPIALERFRARGRR